MKTMPAAAFALFAVAALGDAPLEYDARCGIAGTDAVEGYVSNSGADSYQVLGPVRFVFAGGGSMTPATVESMANAIVPPGKSVLVARARLPFAPARGAQCRFDVKDAIRRL